MPDYRMKLKLEEPLTLGNEPMVSNEIRSLDYIPAVSLRGAFYHELRLNSRTDLVESVLGIDGARWSDAWPVAEFGNGIYLNCVPMPRCFLQHRRDREFGSKEGVINSLAERKSGDGDWVRAGRWLALNSNQEAVSAGDVRTSIDMHLGLHYARQANRSTALFSREAMHAGQEFHAYVSGMPAEARTVVSEISLGKRSSVNGRITLDLHSEPKALGEKYSRLPDAAPQNGVFLQLLTDALLPGAGGGWLRNLDGKRLETEGVARIKDAVVSVRRSRGWSPAWGLPTEQIQVIEAGSVWLVEAAGDGGKFLQWLRELAANGVGMRRHEGFGWMAVSPVWLKHQRVVIGRRDVEAPKGQEPESWPDSRIEREDQKAIASRAARCQLAKEAVPALETLLTMALRNVEADDIRAHLERQAKRSDAWTELQNRIGNSMVGGREEVAFFLEALITELRAKEVGK